MSLLARLSLANRGLVALVAVVITAFGAFAIPSLKQQLLPSLEFPAAFVSAGYPGAAPEIVESQVVAPIENAIQGIPGLSTVTSTSSEGFATVQVEFEFGTDLDDAVNKLETALNRIDSQLPESVDPVVFAGSTDDLPALVLAASGGGGDERALADKLAANVIPELESIEGVRTAEVTGARDQLVVITPNPARLAAAGIAPTAIGPALQANGVAIPAGAVTEADRSLTVQVGTRIGTLDELRGIYLTPTPAAGRPRPPVKLGDVATVEQRLAPPTSFTRTNGADSLGIAVTATPDGNAVGISHEVRDRLAELGAAAGAELTVIFDQAPFVEKSIDSLTTEGLLGLVMAVVVILVFLLSVRSTLVTAVSIPLSVLVALIALWIGDYSLNLLTLGALTIAVGRVVDDSIVVLENIKRHLGYGERKRRAILDGVREVSGAVTASTLTTVAVFAPIAFVGGFVGQLFAPFAITVTVALLASLLVSLTIIPVLAYWFLRPASGGEDEAAVRRVAEEKELRSPLQRIYLPVINFATTRRWATVAIGLVVLLGTFGLSTRLETNFIDDSGQDTLSVRQELPAGTSLTATDAAAKKVEAVLERTRGVKSYQVTVGGGGMFGFGGGSATSATFSVALDEDADSAALQDTLREEFTGLTDAGELTVGGAGGGPGGGSPNELQVIVQAADAEALARAADQVRQAMADTPDVTDVTSSLAESAPRLHVRVKRDVAARFGLSEAAVGQLVAQTFRGAPLGQVTLDGDQQQVVLGGGIPPATVDALRALPVGPVRLGDVADVVEVEGPVQVTRIDGQRSVTVRGTATGSNLGSTTAELTQRLDRLTLPAGATYTVGGVSADQAEAFADLGLAVLAAIAIVFVIMVATFRSLIQPLVLLVSIPFAATGAIGLLLATGTPLGVPALIGVLMLVGIVVTNAIVLMDLINQYRAQGMGVREAVVEGGRRRLRPILMTAIATIFALLPMAFGLTGEGGFISQPLAIVVIGGLISSTLLTLVLVPTLYTMVERTKERIRDRRRGPGRHAAPSAAEPAPSAAEPAAVGAEPARGTDGGAATTAAASGADEPAPEPAAPRPVLAEGTDQFEVLRLPKSTKSPLRPQE
ncbi:hydrophobic/amphiphilic exporter-1, HAE1 family [Micromonospora pattaloongensis]|uniref:Hydrophobic/amphiphilic exporter-1, HAE1 family n=1 Tax=Micromonospora pattaloongensis TaxID=405436 RepID=A0A1H3LU71_9ACTN|nr:efflux RND transporter permease subunit [Micromonospora pattaloongensis]SDY67395.1 hydrophobic/amphiphilic exporter-1, HAE1 family [Micromonospora pattaloongensis]